MNEINLQKKNEMLAFVPTDLLNSNELTKNAKVVLGWLISKISTEQYKTNGYWFASNNSVMDECGITNPNSLQKACAELQVKGYFERIAGKKWDEKSKKTASQYTLKYEIHLYQIANSPVSNYDSPVSNSEKNDTGEKIKNDTGNDTGTSIEYQILTELRRLNDTVNDIGKMIQVMIQVKNQNDTTDTDTDVEKDKKNKKENKKKKEKKGNSSSENPNNDNPLSDFSSFVDSSKLDLSLPSEYVGTSVVGGDCKVSDMNCGAMSYSKISNSSSLRSDTIPSSDKSKAVVVPSKVFLNSPSMSKGCEASHTPKSHRLQVSLSAQSPQTPKSELSQAQPHNIQGSTTSNATADIDDSNSGPTKRSESALQSPKISTVDNYTTQGEKVAQNARKCPLRQSNESETPPTQPNTAWKLRNEGDLRWSEAFFRNIQENTPQQDAQDLLNAIYKEWKSDDAEANNTIKEQMKGIMQIYYPTKAILDGIRFNSSKPSISHIMCIVNAAKNPYLLIDALDKAVNMCRTYYTYPSEFDDIIKRYSKTTQLTQKQIEYKNDLVKQLKKWAK